MVAMKNLTGKVALVAGATRGAGRGIARALGEAGAIVYCSGRSTREHPATAGRPETIDETAEMIASAGGTAIAVRTDHRDVAQVRALMARIRREQGRLDILVNDIWGGDAWMDSWWKEMRFWKIPLEKGFEVIDTAFRTHVITAHEAIPLMLEGKRGGLIAGITDGDAYYYRGQFYYDFVKTSVIRMAFALAYELRKKKIASVAITPGFLRSESMLEIMGVTEANWRDAIRKRPDYAESETPMLVGRGVAAMAADPHVMKKTGRVYNSAELAREYGFTDVDGRVPKIWEYIAEKMPHFPYRKCDDVFYSYWGGFGDGIADEVKKIQKEVAASRVGRIL
jgi:NAD(P)-dependent dehydrogenase (short-subunit alcohol dehydrogenase family)